MAFTSGDVEIGYSLYTYDYRNRLSGLATYSRPDGDSDWTLVSDLGFAYNGFDQRRYVVDHTTSSVLQSCFYDSSTDAAGGLSGGNLALVLDGGDRPLERFLTGPNPDEVFAQENAGGQLYGVDTGRPDNTVEWLLTDFQGTVRDVLDNAGTQINHIVYTAFGQVVGTLGGGLTAGAGTLSWGSFADAPLPAMLYDGYTFDPGTGLYYLNHRYYDPMVGRFITMDPLNFAAGDTDLSRYVGNSPMDGTDPSGLRNNFTYGLGWFLPDWADQWLNGGGGSSSSAPTLPPIPAGPSGGGGASGTGAGGGTTGSESYIMPHMEETPENRKEAQEIHQELTDVLGNVMPGLPPKDVDPPIFDFDLKSVLLKKASELKKFAENTSDRTISAPISFEPLSKNWVIPGVEIPCYTEVEVSMAAEFETEEEGGCKKRSMKVLVAIELGAYIGGEYAKEGQPKLLEEKSEKMLKAEHITQEIPLLKGDDKRPDDVWKIDGKAFISGGVWKFSGNCLASTPPGWAG